MKWITDIVKLTEEYINDYEVNKSPEEIYVEFENIEDVHRDFAKYCKEKKINFDGMKKSKGELARRKVFIKWYVSKHYKRNVDDCVQDLMVILFISESTIYHALYDYR